MSSKDESGIGKHLRSGGIPRDASSWWKHSDRETIEARERLREFEDAVEFLAGRLAATGSTGTPAQLRELVDRYQDALTALEEADSAWLATQRALLASSA